MDFKYPHWRLYNAVIEAFFEEQKDGNQQLGFNELYRKSLSFLNKSSNNFPPDRNKRPSRTTFSHVLEKMKEERIVKEGLKPRPDQIDFSLTHDAIIMRILNLLGISDENMRLTKIYEQILLSIVFSAPSPVLSRSKLNEVLSVVKINQGILELFRTHENNQHGMSIKDFMEQSYVSSSPKFDPDVVERAFAFLEQNNILKKTFFDNDIKYVLAHEKLHKLIQAIGDAFVEELFLLTYKWRHFSQPNKEEEDRLEWIIGSNTSRRIIQLAEIAKFEDKKARRTSNNISEYIDYLKSACLGENERSIIDQELQSYNHKRKISDRTKSSKKYIQDYFAFREKHLKELQSNFLNKIREIQPKYRQTIKEHTFLFRHILNALCPLLLKQLPTCDSTPALFDRQYVDMRIKLAKRIESGSLHK